MPQAIAMPSISPELPLEELLLYLKHAINQGNWETAVDIERQIQMRLVAMALQELATDQAVAIEEEARLLLREAPDTDLPLTYSPERTNETKSASSTNGLVYPVWFGTNRKPRPNGRGFTQERGDSLIRGRVDVMVPEAHRFGETGSSFWKRLLRRTDDRLRIHYQERLEGDVFYEQVKTAIQWAREAQKEPHALLFLHGYNTDFEEAAIRAAQIGFDLNVPGPVAFFSWPSHGSVLSYLADEATIEASERLITEFLIEFAAECQAAGVEKVHVIAHSMGNRGLLGAIQRIHQSAGLKVRFGQIILAAPDVDRDVFVEMAALYHQHADRATLYASRGDLPVYLSSRLHSAPRAGYFEPYTVVAGVDTIAVPDFNIDFLGHGYFAQAEALLQDIYDLINTNTPPQSRLRVTATTADGHSFWKIKK
ncbi:MAG: alpha/beta fold hydrolase [Armatimonas sp.]